MVDFNKALKKRRQHITALIDGDVLVYVVAFSCEKSTDWGDGTHTLHADEEEAKQKIDNFLSTIINEVNADDYIVALSGPTIDNFRKALLPTYKENRSKNRKPLVYQPLRDHLVEKWNAKIKAGIEADDTLGILATKLGPVIKGGPASPKKILCSIDKDFKAVPCNLYNFNAKEMRVIGEDEANRNHMLQTLTGDTTDNYPGCPGIGPKKAEAILDEATTYAEMWPRVVKAFVSKQLTEEDALIQARMARILRAEDYDFHKGVPKLWQPPERSSGS